MNNVFVSVLMPVYNAELYLREAIDSILNQTYKNFELIIINDGSTDKSKEIILSYNDSRIAYYENEKNLKLIETLNKGFDLCKGKYIVRMDADDISLPQRIEKQVKFMEDNPEIGISGTAVHSFGFMEGDFHYKTDDQHIRYKFLNECHLSHPAAIIRTQIIRDHHLKMTILHGEDYDFFLRIAEYSKMANLNDVLLHYRQLESSMSKANSGITYQNCNLLKLTLFHKLDKSLTGEDVILFGEFANQNYGALISRIDAIESIVIRMIKGNEANNIYQKDLFVFYLTELWFGLLSQQGVNTAKFKKVLYSDINKFKNTSITYKLKVAAKLLLRL